MKKTLALFLTLLRVISAAAFAGGCTGAPAAEPTAAPSASTAEPTVEPTQEPKITIETVIVGTTAEILSANRSEYNFDVISGTLSQLAPVWIDETGAYQPLLCDYATGDSRVWTLTVREGMAWIWEGTRVTAPARMLRACTELRTGSVVVTKRSLAHHSCSREASKAPVRANAAKWVSADSTVGPPDRQRFTYS